VVLRPSVGEHGTVFVTGRDGGPGAVPSIALSGEHYNMIARMMQANIPVKLRVNVQSKFYDGDAGNAYNVIAELPGADPAVRDEVVMIGGHLDSWHTGTGATDNADGSTTVIEAMRILKAIGAKPRRTIRVALWGGEEQGTAWVEGLGGAAPGGRREYIGAREVRRLLQYRQRLRSNLRLVPAEHAVGETVVRYVDGAVRRSARPPQHDRTGRFDRSSELRRTRYSRASTRFRNTPTTIFARTTPTWTRWNG
jgi:hypothetical protein